jgi:hypothetical protein
LKLTSIADKDKENAGPRHVEICKHVGMKDRNAQKQKDNGMQAREQYARSSSHDGISIVQLLSRIGVDWQ